MGVRGRNNGDGTHSGRLRPPPATSSPMARRSARRASSCGDVAPDERRHGEASTPDCPQMRVAAEARTHDHDAVSHVPPSDLPGSAATLFDLVE